MASNSERNLLMGRYRASPGTLSDGEISPLLLDSSGRLQTYDPALGTLFYTTGSVDDVAPTTTIIDTDLPATIDDWYKNLQLVFTSGSLIGIGRRIDSYTQATKTITLANALPQAPANGDEFEIVALEFESPAAGAQDWTAAEREDIRDALGVAGAKGGAAGGQLQALQADVGDASASVLGSIYAILGDPASTITSMIDDLETRLTALRAGYLDELDFDLDGRLGAPAGASISADLLAIDNLVDDLEGRLTALRAGYLDELDFDLDARLGAPAGASIAADLLTIDNLVDDLEGRLTALRAGYIDNLNIGETVPTQAQINTQVDTGLSDIHLDHYIAITGAVDDIAPAAADFDTTLASGTNDWYNGMMLLFVSGALAGLARRISDYDGGSKNVILENAFPQAPADTDNFVIVGMEALSGTGPTAAQVADAVWDEILTDHVGAGSFGDALDEIRNKDGGRTFGQATDSLEAIREKLDSMGGDATLANQNLILGDIGDASGSILGSIYAILGDPASTISSMIDDLETRLTALRAGYLDELDFDLDARLGAPAGASISADIAAIEAYVDDLETRLTAARAGYLDELDFDLDGRLGAPAGASVSADIAVLEGRLTALRAGYLDELDFDLDARLGAPAGASISADLLTIDNLVDDLEGRLTALRAGYLDELDFDLDARLGAPAGASVSADIAAITAYVDDLETRLTAARAGYLDELDFDLNARLGAPAGASMSADIAVIDGNVDDIETSQARAVHSMSFWSEDDDLITVTNGAQNLNLPNCVVADLPAGITIIRVIAILKIDRIRDSSGADNAINNANCDLAVDADVAYGSTVDAVTIPDNSFLVDVSESTLIPGTVKVGTVDLASEVTGNATFYARLENAQADGNNLLLYGVGWGLKIYFTL